MEKTTASQVKVGVFILIGMIALITSIFYFGGDRALLTSQSRMKVRFAQVQGLTRGSVVSLAGIVIGNIEDLIFLPNDDQLEIILKFDSKFKSRITEGSTADIRTQGALGDKFIYIEPGPSNHTPLPEGSLIPSVPQTDLIGMLAGRSNDASKVFDILNDVALLTRTLTKDGRAERIVANLVSATDNLNGTSKEARALLAEIRGETGKGSAARLNSILAKLDRGEGTLGALINDPTIHEQLRAFLGGSQRSQNMKSLIRGSIEKHEAASGK